MALGQRPDSFVYTIYRNASGWSALKTIPATEGKLLIESIRLTPDGELFARGYDTQRQEGVVLWRPVTADTWAREVAIGDPTAYDDTASTPGTDESMAAFVGDYGSTPMTMEVLTDSGGLAQKQVSDISGPLCITSDALGQARFVILTRAANGWTTSFWSYDDGWTHLEDLNLRIHPWSCVKRPNGDLTITWRRRQHHSVQMVTWPEGGQPTSPELVVQNAHLVVLNVVALADGEDWVRFVNRRTTNIIYAVRLAQAP